MALSFQPVRVGVGHDGEGRLVYADDVLAAVLVQLGPIHGPMTGWWFLEAGFGPLDVPNPPTFEHLEAAQGWVERRLNGGA